MTVTNEEFALHVKTLAAGQFHDHLVPHDLLHGVIGMMTEVGELLDACKKALYYGKPLDMENVAEEIGDIRFYAQLAMQGAGTTPEEVDAANIQKLKKRYPEGFNMQDALARKDKAA